MKWCVWTSRRPWLILISYLLVPCWPPSARDIRDQTGFEQRHQKFCIDWFSWRETQVFPRGGFYSSSHLYQSYPFAPIDPTDPEDKLGLNQQIILIYFMIFGIKISTKKSSNRLDLPIKWFHDGHPFVKNLWNDLSRPNIKSWMVRLHPPSRAILSILTKKSPLLGLKIHAISFSSTRIFFVHTPSFWKWPSPPSFLLFADLAVHYGCIQWTLQAILLENMWGKQWWYSPVRLTLAFPPKTLLLPNQTTARVLCNRAFADIVIILKVFIIGYIMAHLRFHLACLKI